MPKNNAVGYDFNSLHGAGSSTDSIAANHTGGPISSRPDPAKKPHTGGVSTKPDAPKTPSTFGGVIQKPEDVGRTDGTATEGKSNDAVVRDATNFNNTLLSQMSDPSNPNPSYPPRVTTDQAHAARMGTVETTPTGSIPSYTDPTKTNP